MHTFNSAIGPISWDANEAILTIEMAGRIHLLAWNEVRGAGVVLLPQGSAPDAPVGRHLVIAPEKQDYLLRIPLPVRSEAVISKSVISETAVADPLITESLITDSLITDPLITDPLITDPLITASLITDPLTTDTLEATVRAHLGTRFHTDLTPDTYRKILIPPWANLPDWVMPVAVLGFIGLSAVFLMLMLLIAMPETENWSIVWWQVGLGLVAWLVIVAGFLGVYRKLWIK